MIIYNVTVKVDLDIAADWVQWMQEEHIPDLMKTGRFTGYQLCRILEQDESEGITYTAQYFCTSLREYDSYIQQYAETMREKGLQKFGGKFIAFRTVMEKISS